jgi:predicted Fe-S protein YdhL (DUF1289 family)
MASLVSESQIESNITVGDSTNESKILLENSNTEEVPLLPPPVTEETEEAVEETRKIKLGEKLDLDELGPMIINTDGTVRRIANWDILSPQERASTWRLISARNKKRIAQLKEEEEKRIAAEMAESTEVTSSQDPDLISSTDQSKVSNEI